MIERGEVETLIVKDLSRLGREYLQVGYCTEIYFPQKGVRFIAVNDSVDSLVESSNDFNPIRNWANEQHAKETSKKVRTTTRMQAERGEHSGGKIPYGYKRRPPKHMDEPNMFAGLVFCADCGKPMTLYRAESMNREQFHLKCYTYGHKGKDFCTPHQIRQNDLEKVVLDDLRRVTHFARMKERQFAAYINAKNSAELKKEINILQREVDTMQRRSDELSALFKRLY